MDLPWDMPEPMKEKLRFDLAIYGAAYWLKEAGGSYSYFEPGSVQATNVERKVHEASHANRNHRQR